MRNALNYIESRFIELRAIFPDNDKKSHPKGANMKHINYLVLSILTIFFTNIAYAKDLIAPATENLSNSFPTWVYWLVGIIIALVFAIYVKFKK